MVVKDPNVILGFVSDLNGVEGTGFSIFSTLQPCPVTGLYMNWSEQCSSTCGEGVQERDVKCVILETGEATSMVNCNDPRPDVFVPCNLGECPICDRLIEDTATQVLSKLPLPYPLNQECEFSFESPNGLCWRLFVSVLDFPEADPDRGCIQDYLLLEEDGLYGRSERRCGREDTFFINIRYPNAKLTLITDDVETGNAGFFIAATSLQECPTHGYVAGEFGNCSKDCGGGERSRTVTCLNLRNGNEASEAMCDGETRPSEIEACNVAACPSCDQFFNTTNSVIRSPNYPLRYEPSQVCRYRVNNPDGCIRIEFDDFNLQAPIDGVCSADFLEISDNAPTTDHLTATFCGGRSNSETWSSRSGDVTVLLSTDGSIEELDSASASSSKTVPSMDMFTQTGQSFLLSMQCTVECGSGIQFRNISCINLITMDEALESFCTEEPPAVTQICTLGPCPSCDQTITTQSRISSPDYPMQYPNSANCEYTIFNPEGCITLAFDILDLQADGEECVDSLFLSDDGAPQINTEVCASDMTTNWHSITSNVSVVFSSDAAVSQGGFSFIAVFLPCSDYGYVIDNFGVCSASCGGGIMNRTVSCKRMATMSVVDDSYCLDTKPEEFVACNDLPCPIECSNAISTDTPNQVDFLTSPGYGFVPYRNNERCQNTIINFDGCIVILFNDLDIQPGTTPIDCDRDYVLLSDPSYPSIETRYCGNETPNAAWRSGSSVAQITLVSDGTVRGAGYSLAYNFVNSINCPEYDFSYSAFTACSTSCGDGLQYRSAVCMDDQGASIPSFNCRGDPKTDVRACVPANDPCPSYQYRLGPLSTCSVSCGNGTQSRNVTCVDSEDNPVNETFCEDISRPEDSLLCNLVECPAPVYQIVYGMYTECSATCGAAIRTRTVSCRDSNGLTVSNNLCGINSPTQIDVCTFVPCPEFSVGNYGECSVTCGNGTMSRNVTCNDEIGNIVQIEDCGLPVPETTAPCATGVECMVQEATCGSTVDAINGGNLTSPNYPGNYPPILTVPLLPRHPGSVMLLVFREFDLDLGTGSCDKDFIRY
ncbi:putative cubilin-like [Apostichopus japonicus]|uniref:Putative cubilin-like n=1 Tax=Stichopus japonicus TaxID=307972 RepID=A0A2G8LP18_STIJA|nr:putative cubilin-like [Apostichopus japonicus]